MKYIGIISNITIPYKNDLYQFNIHIFLNYIITYDIIKISSLFLFTGLYLRLLSNINYVSGKIPSNYVYGIIFHWSSASIVNDMHSVFLYIQNGFCCMLTVVFSSFKHFHYCI